MSGEAEYHAPMQAIRIHRRIDSQHLDLPEIASLIGRDVEIIVLDSATSDLAGRPPASRKAGSAKGQVKLAADFDAPLTDFAEYMP